MCFRFILQYFLKMVCLTRHESQRPFLLHQKPILKNPLSHFMLSFLLNEISLNQPQILQRAFSYQRKYFSQMCSLLITYKIRSKGKNFHQEGDLFDAEM